MLQRLSVNFLPPKLFQIDIGARRNFRSDIDSSRIPLVRPVVSEEGLEYIARINSIGWRVDARKPNHHILFAPERRFRNFQRQLRSAPLIMRSIHWLFQAFQSFVEIREVVVFRVDDRDFEHVHSRLVDHAFGIGADAQIFVEAVGLQYFVILFFVHVDEKSPAFGEKESIEVR